MDLTTGFEGCRFALALRNSNNKKFRLSLSSGLRVFCCENLAFQGDFTPVLAKHSKNFAIEDSFAIGVDRIQRNFEPLRRQAEEWQGRQLSTTVAKLIIYQAFIEDELEVPKHLARRIHDLYFHPQFEDFQPRTMWSLSNAFTSAFHDRFIFADTFAVTLTYRSHSDIGATQASPPSFSICRTTSSLLNRFDRI